jgi:hypothetical protein
MSLSVLILTVAVLHLGIVGILMVVNSIVDERNRYNPLYQLQLDIPEPADGFVGYPSNYAVNEGDPAGD